MALLYASLVDEPFRLSLDEIANLTDRQIYEIYLRKVRDRQADSIDSLSLEDQFRFYSRRLGMSEEDIERAWAKHVAAEKIRQGEGDGWTAGK